MKKIALITGGNSGIGYATARLLKEKGYVVFISGRNQDSLRQAADELGIRSIITDMSDLEDITRLASNFLETGLDVLVNNAGVAKSILVSDFTLEDFSEVFDTNVRGTLLLIQKLLPALERRQATITTVTSIATDNGLPANFLYAASKGSVNAFTRNLAVELAPKGIRVNAIAPGVIDTPIFEKIGLSPEAIAEVKEELKSIIPLGRFGTPDEVAQVILAQVESTYVTGSVWIVDGGVSASS